MAAPLPCDVVPDILRAVHSATGNELAIERDPFTRFGYTLHARCGTCRARWSRSFVVDAMRFGSRALYEATLDAAGGHVCSLDLGPAGKP